MIACAHHPGKRPPTIVLRNLCLLTALALAIAARADVLPVPVPPMTGAVSVGPYAEVLEDSSHALTLDDVRAADARFTRPGTQVLNFGYSYSAWWLRFRLEPGMPEPQDWFLEIAFPTLDQIDLYLPRRLAGGGLAYVSKRAGDTQPWDAREVKHRNHVLCLIADPADGEWIYLRVQSRSVVTVPLRLQHRTAFVAAERDAQLVYGLFYGLVLALFLYNLMLCATLRDPAYAWYVLYVAAFGLSLFVLDGFAFQYLWPDNIWWANHSVATGLCLTLTFAALFARRFLALPKMSPVADRMFLGAAGLGVLGAVLAATGLLVTYGTILRSLSVVAVAMAAMSVYVAVQALVRGYRPARFFLLAWSALLVFIALGALRNYALVPTHFLTVNGLHIGLALDVLLLSFALADRINAMEREKKSAQTEVLASHQALLEATRANERELERGIVARTAELNRANERLREEAAEREGLVLKLRAQEQDLRFMAQHDALTGLPNRHSMQQRLALAIELAKRNRKKVAVMLIDLDRFKQLNDSRGHAAGDQALAVIAERLRTSVRGSDTVARYGGDEFVVIAADLDRAALAGSIAEKIADMASLPVPLEGGAWRGGCSIGISVYPDDAEDAVQLLLLADKTMYGVKSNAGARYAFYAESA